MLATTLALPSAPSSTMRARANPPCATAMRQNSSNSALRSRVRTMTFARQNVKPR